MKTTPKEFPEDYRKHSEYRAIAAVFDDLCQSRRAGSAILKIGEPNRPRDTHAIVWLEGEGRFVAIARGGHYSLDPEKTQWYLNGPDGPVEVADPLQQAADAARAVRDEIHRQKSSWSLSSPWWFSAT